LVAVGSVALALSACGGRIVPPSTYGDQAEVGAAPAPARPNQHHLARPDQPLNVRPSDGRIVGAVPYT